MKRQTRTEKGRRREKEKQGDKEGGKERERKETERRGRQEQKQSKNKKKTERKKKREQSRDQNGKEKDGKKGKGRKKYRKQAHIFPFQILLWQLSKRTKKKKSLPRFMNTQESANFYSSQ